MDDDQRIMADDKNYYDHDYDDQQNVRLSTPVFQSVAARTTRMESVQLLALPEKRDDTVKQQPFVQHARSKETNEGQSVALLAAAGTAATTVWATLCSTSTSIQDRLPMMHPYYPLTKRTHVKIAANNATGLVERLLDTFRCLSLNAETFERPSFCARCSSMDSVQLTVNLWKTSTAARHNNEMSVVVEVQRTAGDSIKAMQYTRTILEAATNRNSNNNNKKKKAVPSVFQPHRLYPSMERMEQMDMSRSVAAATIATTANESMDVDTEDILDGVLHAHWKEAIDLATAFVSSPRLDARSMGLQTVLSLTDPNQSGLEMARRTSTFLLLNNDATHCHPIPHCLMSLIMTGTWPDDNSNQNFEDSASPLNDEHAYMALMILTRAVVVVVANSTRVVQPSDKDHHNTQQLLSTFVSAFQEEGSTSSSLATRLQEWISQSHQRPHTAYWAAILWQALWPFLSSSSNNNSSSSSIHKAHRVGLERHAALEWATAQLLLARVQA